MGLYRSFNDVFDDTFYNIIDEDFNQVEVFNMMKPKLGDVVIYNFETHNFDVMSKERCGIENDNAIIGIVINVNNDTSVDVIMKNFLTTECVHTPIKYIDKPKFIPAYLKDIFDRYCSKYQRVSDIDISLIKYTVPNIALLDYMLKNLSILYDTLISIWGEERADDFVKRLYNFGLFSTYKNKFYKWLPVINEKRQILNLTVFSNNIEFLPTFTLSY